RGRSRPDINPRRRVPAWKTRGFHAAKTDGLSAGQAPREDSFSSRAGTDPGESGRELVVPTEGSSWTPPARRAFPNRRPIHSLPRPHRVGGRRRAGGREGGLPAGAGKTSGG